MRRPIQEEDLQLLARRRVDPHAGVPFRWSASFRRHAAAAIADRVALELDGHSAAVADLLPFILFEWMVTFGRQEQEPVPVADVLHVGQAAALAGCALPFADGDLVLVDELAVDLLLVLPRFDPPRDIEPVAVPQVAHGDLLNQTLGRTCDATILHGASTSDLRFNKGVGFVFGQPHQSRVVLNGNPGETGIATVIRMSVDQTKAPAQQSLPQCHFVQASACWPCALISSVHTANP